MIEEPRSECSNAYIFVALLWAVKPGRRVRGRVVARDPSSTSRLSHTQAGEGDEKEGVSRFELTHTWRQVRGCACVCVCVCVCVCAWALDGFIDGMIGLGRRPLINPINLKR